MRALCLTATGGPEHLQLLDIDPPTLVRDDEVRVGIRAVALNHLDLFVANGLKAVPIESFPHVVAADGAGEVLQVGSAVERVRPGDRVVINPGISCGECDDCINDRTLFCRDYAILGEHRGGVAAEEVVVPERNVMKFGWTWGWPESAAFPLATMTAWRMLVTRAAIREGEAVLIWGIGGGVAQQALQIARLHNARVAVTSSSDAKLERARALGAELALNHASERDIVREVKQHFGAGVDIVVDNVGEPTWERSCRALKPGGRLVCCGATGGADATIDLRRLFWFQWSILGSTMATSAELREAIAHATAGKLRPVIDGIYSLEQGQAAYRRMTDPERFGKVVLQL